MGRLNCYADAKRAEAYARLEFPGTYYLAYRDLPDLFFEYVSGRKAIDFGCGAGRSTRFLKRLGFNTLGVDIAKDMITKAKEKDPTGAYLLIKDGTLDQLKANSYDLVMSAFAFDNISTMEKKVTLFRKLANLLNNEGIIINLVSAPEIYLNEWASFSTKAFPENRNAQSGDKVKIIITAIDDERPVEDFIWTDEDYREVYKKAALRLVNTYKPLAQGNEPYSWINETQIAPWTIYVLKRAF